MFSSSPLKLLPLQHVLIPLSEAHLHFLSFVWQASQCNLNFRSSSVRSARDVAFITYFWCCAQGHLTLFQFLHTLKPRTQHSWLWMLCYIHFSLIFDIVKRSTLHHNLISLSLVGVFLLERDWGTYGSQPSCFPGLCKSVCEHTVKGPSFSL